VQHYSSKGTCERGGTNYTNGEGKNSRAIGDTTLQSRSKANEDRVRLFCDSMVKCISSEIGNITDHLTARSVDALAFGLQETLSSTSQPGTYCEVHDEPVPTNTMSWRSHEAIALGPTGNLQGSIKFYCINTGRVLKRHSFTPMPMSNRPLKSNKLIWLIKCYYSSRFTLLR
jgi:hypothetical protein